MSDWAEFLVWARRLTEYVDVVAEERGDKVELATRISELLSALRAGDADVLDELHRLLTRDILVDKHFLFGLADVLKGEGREPLRAAIVDLVDSAEPVKMLDIFSARVLELYAKASPGNRVALGSVLLMATDPATYPPYRPTLVETWAKLVGKKVNVSASGRYQDLLDLCDGLVEQARDTDLRVNDRLDAQGLAFRVFKSDPNDRWTPLELARFAAVQGGKDPEAAVVDRGSGAAPAIEAGAWRILGAGLRGETSAIDPTLRTWTVENARGLRHRISTDPGGSSWMDKLPKQVDGADDAVLVLLAELLFLRLAPLDDVKGTTKVDRVNTILGWCATPRDLPTDLAGDLARPGAFTGGQGYHTQAPSHMLWLARFVEHWLTTGDDERREALRDPFVFRDLAAGTPQDVPSIRYALEYLAWPGIFPPVVSADHRNRIHTNLLPDLGEPSGQDDRAQTHDLVALQRFHHPQAKGKPKGFQWYRSPYVDRWRPKASAASKAWIVRRDEGGATLVERWTTDGFVSLAAKSLGDVEPGADKGTVTQAVQEGYGHLDASQREAAAAAYHAFLTSMKIDDLVATISGGRLRVGVVTGAAHYVDQDGSRLRRDVQWSPTVVRLAEAPAPLPSLLDQQGMVVDATRAYDILESLLESEGSDESEQAPREHPRPAVTPPLPAVTEEVAQALHMDRDALQEVVELLQQRQQVVLYGPPGTGKTYLAKELAKHLVGDPSRVRLVQFHPSYSYEDFFEGYRPAQTETGEPTFQLKDGPLRLLAAEASNPDNRENVYILIIDEMNRANIAKVFGELYFLLEYRTETVRLQYQPEIPFYLPPNLFIIGTMNTSDRSIALVDAAIRRRFPFVELHPSEPPVAGVLARWMAVNQLSDDRAALLDELNRRMGEGGRDLQIGPSYLMRAGASSDRDIDRIWRYDILPLLEEHFYGQLDRAALRDRFGIAALRASLLRTGVGGDVSGLADGSEVGGDVVDPEDQIPLGDGGEDAGP